MVAAVFSPLDAKDEDRLESTGFEVHLIFADKVANEAEVASGRFDVGRSYWSAAPNRMFLNTCAHATTSSLDIGGGERFFDLDFLNTTFVESQSGLESP